MRLIAHISGIVATKQHPSPFVHCDVVTTTTHKSGALAPEFVEYSKAVVSNAGTFAEALIAKGHKLASGGTDNHLVLWVLCPHGLTGSKVEKVCEAASISLNRNTVPGDASALFSRWRPHRGPCDYYARLYHGGLQEDCKFTWTGSQGLAELGYFLFQYVRLMAEGFSRIPSAITWASGASPSRCSSSTSYLTNSSE